MVWIVICIQINRVPFFKNWEMRCCSCRILLKACLVVLAIVFSPVLFCTHCCLCGIGYCCHCGSSHWWGAVLWSKQRQSIGRLWHHLRLWRWQAVWQVWFWYGIRWRVSFIRSFGEYSLATDGNWSEVVFTGSLDTRFGYFLVNLSALGWQFPLYGIHIQSKHLLNI